MSGRLRIGFGKNSEPLGVAFDLTDGGLGGLEFGDVDPRCVGDASKRGRGRPFLFWSLVPFLVVTFFFSDFQHKNHSMLHQKVCFCESFAHFSKASHANCRYFNDLMNCCEEKMTSRWTKLGVKKGHKS